MLSDIVAYRQPPKQHISLPTSPAATIKSCLVHLGLEALREDDQPRIALITRLLQDLEVSDA
jgi:hypothetical protein